jgi:gamma-glutamyltranspeptidase
LAGEPTLSRRQLGIDADVVCRDAFCLFYDAKEKTVKGLNGSGRSPKNLTLEYARSRGLTGKSIPMTDLNSVTVPGCAAAWVDTVELLGGGKLSVADVFAPAIRLAEEGVPVSEIHAHAWARSEKLIKNASPNADEMLLNGVAPKAGQIKTFPTLAQTFREVAEKGADGFYKGRIAEEIVKLIQSKGGRMDLEDLAAHKTDWIEPIKYTYSGEVTVYEVISSVIWLQLSLKLTFSVHLTDRVSLPFWRSASLTTSKYRAKSSHSWRWITTRLSTSTRLSKHFGRWLLPYEKISISRNSIRLAFAGQY